MENIIRVTVESKFGHNEVFEGQCIMGAFITGHHSKGTDISQFLLGNMNEKDMVSMLSGLFNNFYVAGLETPKILKMVMMALQTARLKHEEEQQEEQFPWMQHKFKF